MSVTISRENLPQVACVDINHITSTLRELQSHEFEAHSADGHVTPYYVLLHVKLPLTISIQERALTAHGRDSRQIADAHTDRVYCQDSLDLARL